MVIPYLGVGGAVVFAFGLIGGFALGESQGFAHPFVLVHIILGLGALVWWFVATAKNRTPSVEAVRRAKYGGFTIASTVLFVALVVAAYWFAGRYNRRFDLTENGVFSLSPKSVEVVKNLKAPLELVGIIGASKDPRTDDTVRETLALFADAAKGLVNVKLINPVSRPQEADKYKLKPGNLVALRLGKPGDAGFAESRVDDVSEESLTNAIIKLSKGAAKKVYFLQGHGEPGIKDAGGSGFERLAKFLSDQHFDPKPLSILENSAIPSDAALVVVANPTRPLLAPEIEALTSYRKQGGRLLLLGETRPTTSAVADLAAGVGITIRPDIVIDRFGRLIGGSDVTALGLGAAKHAITQNFGDAVQFVFPMASSLATADSVPEGGTITALVSSGAQAWGESNLAALFASDKPTAALDGADTKGPVTLAAVYENQAQADNVASEAGDVRSTRVVVFGDTEFATNQWVDNNRDLIVNTISWLAGEESALTIGPRSMRVSTAPMRMQEFKLLLASSLLIPELIALFGIVVWTRRKLASTV